MLFQMDSADSGVTDNHNFIIFGDAGIGRFCIPYEDLKEMNFSHVTYDWDCC